MKRKIAAFMAGAMLLGAAFPINVLAKTSNNLVPNHKIVYDDTSLIIDARIENVWGSDIPRLGGDHRDDYHTSANSNTINSVIGNNGSGIDLEMVVSNLKGNDGDIEQNDAVVAVLLDNAKWYFYDSDASSDLFDESDGDPVQDLNATYGYTEALNATEFDKGNGALLIPYGPEDDAHNTDYGTGHDFMIASGHVAEGAAAAAGSDMLAEDYTGTNNPVTFLANAIKTGVEELQGVFVPGQDLASGIALEDLWGYYEGTVQNEIDAWVGSTRNNEDDEKDIMMLVAMDYFEEKILTALAEDYTIDAPIYTEAGVPAALAAVEVQDMNLDILFRLNDEASAMVNVLSSQLTAGETDITDPTKYPSVGGGDDVFLFDVTAFVDAYLDFEADRDMPTIIKEWADATEGASNTLSFDTTNVVDSTKEIWLVDDTGNKFSNEEGGTNVATIAAGLIGQAMPTGTIAKFEDIAAADYAVEFAKAAKVIDFVKFFLPELPKLDGLDDVYADVAATVDAAVLTDELLLEDLIAARAYGEGFSGQPVLANNPATDLFQNTGAAGPVVNGEPATGYFRYAERTTNGNGNGIFYALQVTDNDPSIAYLYIDMNGDGIQVEDYEDGDDLYIPRPEIAAFNLTGAEAAAYRAPAVKKDDVLVLPFVIQTIEGDDPVTYEIINENTGSTSFLDGSSGTKGTLGTVGTKIGKTTSEFASVVTSAKGRIYLDDLEITENTPDVLKNGYFIVIPPDGFNMAPAWDATGEYLEVEYTYGLASLNDNDTPEVQNAGTIELMDENGDTKWAQVLEISGLYDGPAGGQRQWAGTLTIAGLAVEPQTNDPEMVEYTGSDLSIDIVDVSSLDTWLDDNDYWFTDYDDLDSNMDDYAENNYAEDGNEKERNRGDLDGDSTDPISNTRITTQRLAAFQRAPWSISYTAADPMNRYSGRVNQETAEISVVENTRDTWTARKDTTFTLVNAAGEELEDVKITRVEVKSDNFTIVGESKGTSRKFSTVAPTSSSDGRMFYNTDVEGKRVQNYGNPYNEANTSFNRSANTFTVTDLYTDTGELGELSLVFYLSAAANFEDEVWVKIGGSAIDEDDLNGVSMVKVANFYRPVSVETSNTEVAIGYQTYEVADVVIKENNIANVGTTAFETGEKVQLSVGEFGDGRLTNAMISFNPIHRNSTETSDLILTGDSQFTVSNPGVVNVSGATINLYSQKALEFTVMRKGKTAAGEIHLSNLSMTIDRTVAEGNYDLLVGGKSLVNNFTAPNSSMLYQYDTFDTFGVVYADYVTVGTPGADAPQKNFVEIPCENNIYTIKVNGEDYDLEVPLVIMDDQRLYVPTRFIAQVLGVRDENISFDDGTRKVMILTPERTITFQQNSDVYTVNGVEMNMIDESTLQPMYCWLDAASGRTYVPYQYLAKALAIAPTFGNGWYNGETNSVQFNVTAAPVVAAAEVPAE